MEDKELLAALTGQPGWGELFKLMERRMEWEFNTLAKKQMHGKNVPYHEIAYTRGFFAGMKFLLDRPEASAKELNAQLEKERRELSGNVGND